MCYSATIGTGGKFGGLSAKAMRLNMCWCLRPANEAVQYQGAPRTLPLRIRAQLKFEVNCASVFVLRLQIFIFARIHI